MTTPTRARRNPLGLTLGNPSTGGNNKIVKLGARSYGFARGERIAHSQLNGGAVLYSLDLRGDLHVFTSSGEIFGLPDALVALVKSSVFHVEADD